MSKEEFLQGLEQALVGNVSGATVRENLDYYNDYITSQIRQGRAEQEILDELGDPRLIARTILDTTPGAGEGIYEQVVEDERSGGGQANGSTREFGGNIHYYDLSKWYWKLLTMVIIIAVVVVVITVITGFLSLVIPLLPVIGLVILIMWFVQGPRR